MKPDWEFAAALLAGGKSVRMGSDKAQIEIDGVPLWTRGMTLLQSLNPARLLISINRDQSRVIVANELDMVDVLVDPPEGSNPLSALSRCLQAAGELPLVLLAVDMPRMEASFLLDDLLKGANPERGRCFHAGRLQPFAALYPQAIQSLARKQIAESNFSLTDCIRLAQKEGLMEKVDIPEESAGVFANVNRPEDMQDLQDGR